MGSALLAGVLAFVAELGLGLLVRAADASMHGAPPGSGGSALGMVHMLPMMLSSVVVFLAIKLVGGQRWTEANATRLALVAWATFVALEAIAWTVGSRPAGFAIQAGGTVLFSLAGAALGGVDAFNRAWARRRDAERATADADDDARRATRRARGPHRDG
ncbi:MAG: hypothetical protein HY275_09480 [Gemmatimonadetes bacterium]|nr:hypothetical protein [Gemmatimonadota bacterium]